MNKLTVAFRTRFAKSPNKVIIFSAGQMDPSLSDEVVSLCLASVGSSLAMPVRPMTNYTKLKAVNTKVREPHEARKQ